MTPHLALAACSRAWRNSGLIAFLAIRQTASGFRACGAVAALLLLLEVIQRHANNRLLEFLSL